MREVKIFCDICKKNGDSFPSWFYLTETTKSNGDGTFSLVPDKVEWGYPRYENVVDLCSRHRDEIVVAIQKIVDEFKSAEEAK